MAHDGLLRSVESHPLTHCRLTANAKPYASEAQPSNYRSERESQAKRREGFKSHLQSNSAKYFALLMLKNEPTLFDKWAVRDRESFKADGEIFDWSVRGENENRLP